MLFCMLPSDMLCLLRYSHLPKTTSSLPRGLGHGLFIITASVLLTTIHLSCSHGGGPSFLMDGKVHGFFAGMDSECTSG